MRILHINNTDLIGKRFNGYSLIEPFRQMGHTLEQAVWDKHSDNDSVWPIVSKRNFLVRWLNRKAHGIEKRLSLQSVFYLSPLLLLFNRRFWKADIIHLHLIHNEFFSILLLPILTRIKRTFWTIHDPWAFTGHCTHPKKCNLWTDGCNKCPDLNTYISMRKDNAHLMWKLKKWAYTNSKFEAIVSSEWMKQRISKSPLFLNKTVHVLPFGVDTNKFCPGNKQEAKTQLGIPSNKIVLFCRATLSEYKGFDFIVYALNYIKSKNLFKDRLCILTSHEKGLLNYIDDYFLIKDLGWNNELANAYCASDIFLMPSLHESFGMMALEAMSAGIPVLTFQDTAMAEIVKDKQSGILAKYSDYDSFLNSLLLLLENDNIRENISATARANVLERYSLNQFTKSLISLYSSQSPTIESKRGG